MEPKPVARWGRTTRNSGASAVKRRQRRLTRLAGALTVALLAGLPVALPASAQVNPAVVGESGPIMFTVTGGSLGLGGIDLPLPPCDAEGLGCLSFMANIGPDGRFMVAAENLQLPSFDLPLDQLNLGLPIGLTVEAFTAGAVSGFISPSGRFATLNLGFGIRILPDLSTLGALAFIARGASCGLGPIHLSLTSGGSGSVMGSPYDTTTGAVTLADGIYGVPALGCSPLMTTILPLLAGDTLGDVDIFELLDTANQSLGLPSQTGDNAVVFDVEITRTVDGQRVPLISGGALWPVSGFRDVPIGAHFDQAVRWLKVRGITTGLGGSVTTFGAGDRVNRGQMAAFLWRMMDLRNAPAECGFADIRSSAYFSRAVCWLKAQEITTGVGGDTSRFAPERQLTRGEMALFLWRLAGEPEGSPPPVFTDLVSGAAYVPAVAWMAVHGLTTGINGDATRFAPGALVTRAQMASLLYRLASSPAAWDPTSTVPSTMLAQAG